jgi:tRNA G18 (ribose-2'-O)-methylase SpoU
MPVIEVSDPADPRLADFAHGTDVLLKNGRGPHGLYIAESALVLERALKAGHSPRAVLALGNTVDEAVALVGPNLPIFTAATELLAELTGYVLHRGLVASVERPPLPDAATLLAGARRVVILENVVDPSNVGAIFRSVAAIGADAVLITPHCSDPFYRRAIRVSMGAVLQVPWTRVGGWADTGEQPAAIELLTASGFHLAALALNDRAVSLRDFAANPPDRIALVVGTEGGGLTPEALAAADTIVQIPMRHGIDSLNVAAAAAVAIWALAWP